MPRIALKDKMVLAPRSFFLRLPLDIHPDIEWMKGIVVSLPNTKKNIHTYSINWDYDTYDGKFELGQLRTEISKDDTVRNGDNVRNIRPRVTNATPAVVENEEGRAEEEEERENGRDDNDEVEEAALDEVLREIAG